MCHLPCLLILENIPAECQVCTFAAHRLSSVQADGYTLQACLSVSQATLVDIPQHREFIAVTELAEENKRY